MIRELHGLLTARKISAVELAETYLRAIERDNPTLNAYVCLTPDVALAAAARADGRFARGESLGLLDGIPMTLKDNISTRGIQTTCCSNMLKDYVPVYDAFVWEQLQAQGAVLLGKTNMDEFAMGSTGETSVFGGAKNPYCTARVPGGSSSGGAAAVAGRLAVYALGSDTGGSIRQPASFCGATGLKPTYGAVSRYGLIAHASSFDQIGPIACCVEDAAAVFDAICRRDVRDDTCTGARPVGPALRGEARGLRVGVVREFFDGMESDVRAALERAMQTFRGLGATFEEDRLPSLPCALPVYTILACAEASSNLGRYDGIRYGRRTAHPCADVHDMVCKTRSEGFGEEVRRRILLGTYVLSAGHRDTYYNKALRLREQLRAEFDALFSRCDVLLAPTTLTAAFAPASAECNPVKACHADICTAPVNLAGLPAISLPCGQTAKGLPVGLQLIAGRGQEATLLRAALAYEQAAGTLPAPPFGVRL